MVVGGKGHSTHFLVDALKGDQRFGRLFNNPNLPFEATATMTTPTSNEGSIATSLAPSALLSTLFDDQTEAELMRGVLVHGFGVPHDAIVLETQSTNCGNNASFARTRLEDIGESLAPTVKSIMFIKDPTMQQRTHQSFLKNIPNYAMATDLLTGASNSNLLFGDVRLLSYAPFIPYLSANVGKDSKVSEIEEGESIPEYCYSIRQLSHFERGIGVVGDGLVVDECSSAVWEVERFVSLVMGEVPRLRDDETGYGPMGSAFITHCDIPEEVRFVCVCF
jgi:hypothetical protein